MKFTGERVEKKQRQFSKRFADHLKRYEFAKTYCKDKSVLDIACGTGYGTYELAQVATKVLGVDIDQDAVKLAKDTYKNDNLSYLQ